MRNAQRKHILAAHEIIHSNTELMLQNNAMEELETEESELQQPESPGSDVPTLSFSETSTIKPTHDEGES